MSTTNGSTARTGHGGKVVVGWATSTDVMTSGDIYVVSRVTSWSVNPTASEAAWADSDSAGYTNRRSGRRDCTGSIGGKLDMTYPQYHNVLFRTDIVGGTDPENNDMVQIVLWEDGNEATPSTYWFFPRALISNFQMTVDIDTRDPVDWTADFGADGVFYRPGETVYGVGAQPTVTYGTYSPGNPSPTGS
jgi:hypothetical protein